MLSDEELHAFCYKMEMTGHRIHDRLSCEFYYDNFFFWSFDSRHQNIKFTNLFARHFVTWAHNVWWSPLSIPVSYAINQQCSVCWIGVGVAVQSSSGVILAEVSAGLGRFCRSVYWCSLAHFRPNLWLLPLSLHLLHMSVLPLLCEDVQCNQPLNLVCLYVCVCVYVRFIGL